MGNIVFQHLASSLFIVRLIGKLLHAFPDALTGLSLDGLIPKRRIISRARACQGLA
jgi:hypothetical protein